MSSISLTEFADNFLRELNLKRFAQVELNYDHVTSVIP